MSNTEADTFNELVLFVESFCMSNKDLDENHMAEQILPTLSCTSWVDLLAHCDDAIKRNLVLVIFSFFNIMYKFVRSVLIILKTRIILIHNCLNSFSSLVLLGGGGGKNVGDSVWCSSLSLLYYRFSVLLALLIPDKLDRLTLSTVHLLCRLDC